MRVRWPILMLGLGLLGACGSEPSSAVQRSNPQSVFEGAMNAFTVADLPGLHGVLTARGRGTFLADLRAFRDGLSLPANAQGATRHLLDVRFPDEAADRLKAAREGGPATVLRLLVALRPVNVPAQPRSEKRSEDVRVFFYRDAQDIERSVRLVREKGVWSVDRLEF